MLAPRKTLHSTPLRVFRRALALVDAHKGDVLLDLGCGDGRLVVDAALTFGLRAVGVEIDGLRAREAREAARRAGVERLVTVETANALEFQVPSDATIVFLFLIDRGLSLVRPQLERAAHENLRVITYLYRIPGVAPDMKHFVEAKDGAAFPIFIYRFPLRPELPHKPIAIQDSCKSDEESAEETERASTSSEGELDA